jgi:hypothetical protein
MSPCSAGVERLLDAESDGNGDFIRFRDASPEPMGCPLQVYHRRALAFRDRVESAVGARVVLPGLDGVTQP